MPVEIGGKRSRRIDLARTAAVHADIDVRAAMRTLRRTSTGSPLTSATRASRPTSGSRDPRARRRGRISTWC